MATQKEIAELVDYFHDNVDEAEQFSDHIKTLIYGCKKEVLLDILEDLTDAVDYNLNFEKKYPHSKYNDCLLDDFDKIEEKIKTARKILSK